MQLRQGLSKVRWHSFGTDVRQLNNLAASANITSGPQPLGTCVPNCTVWGIKEPVLYWTQRQIVTTIVAATVVFVVNDMTNSTRTTTVFNTNLHGYTLPTDVNADGTRTIAITQYDPVASTDWTTIV